MTESAIDTNDQDQGGAVGTWLLLLGTDNQQVNLLHFRSASRHYPIDRVRIAGTARTLPACERLLRLLRSEGVDAGLLEDDGGPVELEANDLRGCIERLEAAMMANWGRNELLVLGYSRGAQRGGPARGGLRSGRRRAYDEPGLLHADPRRPGGLGRGRAVAGRGSAPGHRAD